jgi:hypothetical protein
MTTLNLFLETPLSPGSTLPTLRPKLDVMLFFKHYCPDVQPPSLHYVGRRLVPKDTKIKVHDNAAYSKAMPIGG